jgi:NAD(P)-dependent dehydrogenase (short-subunit alcohol dehydrogenase family)
VPTNGRAHQGLPPVAACQFAAYGATVILIGRTIQKLEQVYDAIETAGGAQPAIYPICLEGAAEKDYEDMRDRLEETFERLDGLLHNAGVLGQRTPIVNYKLSTWQKVMQVNVTAEFMMTQALLPLLEKSDNASLIFTTSGVGRIGRPFWGAYAVSKFATEGFAQVLANELDETSNIRVNCINPGPTRTQMRATAYPAENPSSVKTPEDIMPIYLYLMGGDSKGLTGQSLDAQ